MENMRTEAIELFNEMPFRQYLKPILVKVLKGVLVAASVCITASVVSKEETVNPGTVEKSILTAAESGRLYFGIGSEVTEEANSILEMMENHVSLTRAVLSARENVSLDRYERFDQFIETKGSSSAAVSDSMVEEIKNPAENGSFSDTAAGAYALTFEGALPLDYCVGSTIDLSDITLLYGDREIALEKATVEIPDTGKAGTYQILAEYNGSRTEIPFGVVDYKVHLNGNGGTCYTDVLYLTDYMIKEEVIPSRPGKEFTGWYRDEACTIPFEGAKRGETSLELYAGWKDYTGFLCDEQGYITSYTGEGYQIIDGLLVLPNEDGCVGVRAGALDNFADEIFEIYIPAGITDIEPGALENLSLLFYIEVNPDNPVYVSREGILYNKESNDLVLLPAGR